MRPIGPPLASEVWSEITSYPPERAEREAAAFLERQPHVAAFCRTVTRAFDESAQRVALGLAFVVVKTLKASRGAPCPLLARERLAEA